MKFFTGIFHDFLATGKNSKTFISSFSLMLRATVESIPFHYQQLAIAKVESSSYIHWIKPYDLINEESRTTDICFYCLNVSMSIMNIRNESDKLRFLEPTRFIHHRYAPHLSLKRAFTFISNRLARLYLVLL